jgi:TetR/AcrR family transcriptional regulator, regulator of cefoperazone and chloramphenicol sensitivity
MSRRVTKAKRQHPKAGPQPVVYDNTRAKLLDAAGQVFAEVGYHAATIRKICARAGTNIALVNYHFRDKFGLYTEVLRQSVCADQLQAVRNLLAQGAPPEDILRVLIRARLQSACGGDRPDWHFRIMAHELAQPTPALSQVINETMRPIYGRLREIIGGLLGLSPDDGKTRLCAHSVMSQVLFYALARPVLVRLWPEFKMTPEQLDQIADHIADFSLAYLRETGSKDNPVAALEPAGRRE